MEIRKEILYNFWGNALYSMRENLIGKFGVSIADRATFEKDHNRKELILRIENFIYNLASIPYQREVYFKQFDALYRDIIILLTDYLYRMSNTYVQQKETLIKLGKKWISDTSICFAASINYYKYTFKETCFCTDNIERELDLIVDIMSEDLPLFRKRSSFDLTKILSRQLVELTIDFEVLNESSWQIQSKNDKVKTIDALCKKKNSTEKDFKSKFFSYIIRPELSDKIISTLETMLIGKVGRNACLVIKATERLGYITKPSHASINAIFGDIGAASGYNKYMQTGMLSGEELEPVMNQIKSMIQT